MPAVPAKRKTHSKSRAGCLQCKKRHTKCNEKHPQCANCIRLDVKCEWPPPQLKVQTASPNSEPSVASRDDLFSTSCRPTHAVGEGPAFTLEDMQLLHHWTTKVYLFHDASVEEDRRLWSEGVVEIGFQHPFLLHGLLALAALHKTLVDPSGKRASLLAQADAHMSAALATYLRLIEESATETVVPCFILSSICFAYNLASAQVDEPEDPLGAILHCFRLLRGVKVVIGQHWEQLQQNDVIHNLLTPVRNLEEMQLPEETTCVPLLELRQLAEQTDSPQREICLVAIEDLHKIFVKTTLCSTVREEHSIVMTWPARLTTEFLDLCHARNSVSSLVIVYWAVLIARNPHSWWLTGWLSRLTKACEELFAPTPELKKWLEWPIEFARQHPSLAMASHSTHPSLKAYTPADGTILGGTTPKSTPGIAETS